MSKEKYPCPNCNREIFPGTSLCPYCNTPLSIFKYARAPINFIEELDRLAKPPVSDVWPIFYPILHLAGTIFAGFIGFLVFLAVNYSPFIFLHLDYIVGTVFLTIFPATFAQVGVTAVVARQLYLWLNVGLMRRRHTPKPAQLTFSIFVWAIFGYLCFWVTALHLA
jgi:hypothetical protein